MGFYSSFIIRFESMVQLNGALEAVHVTTQWKVHYRFALFPFERPEQPPLVNVCPSPYYERISLSV